MEMLATVISGLVIVCLLGAMLYATKAIKAQRSNKPEERRKNLTMAGVLFAGYLFMNMVRLFVENQLI